MPDRREKEIYSVKQRFFRFLLRQGPDLGFFKLVAGVCSLLYILGLGISFLAGLETSPGGSFLNVLAPHYHILLLFGATGSVPVFEFGRWWTVLSSAWLHGGFLHILFNMLWISMLAPLVASLYGPGRMVIIYTLAAIGGGVATTLISGYFPDLPGPFRGASLSIGASGAVFGLLAAMVYYGKRVGSHPAGQQAWSLALVLFIFGIVMPGVDNWGHLGGFIGGFGAAWMLDPRSPERKTHLLSGIACVVISVLSVFVSIIHGFFLMYS